jgi:hypothetical protein
VQPRWKKIWRLLKNLNIDLPYDPAMVGGKGGEGWGGGQGGEMTQTMYAHMNK